MSDQPKSPYFNPLKFASATVVRADAVNAEFAKIRAAFDKLPDPTAIPNGGGAPNYTHYAYADSADGTSNFTTGPANNRDYVGVSVNQPSQTPSEQPEDYTWSRLKGVDGTDGNDGNDGDDGNDGSDGTNGQYTEYRFIRSLFQPVQATGDNPAGTSLSIPDGNTPVWLTQADRDGAGVLLTPWSVWVRLSPYPDPEEYDASQTYYEGQQVTFGGGTYILIVASSVGVAPSGTAQANGTWGVIAAPGNVGDPATPPSGFSATIDLTSTNNGANLRTIADAAGYTGKSDATILFRVPSGVTVTGVPGSGSGAGAGIDTGTWPKSSYSIALSIVVQSGGIVNGGGGRGGNGGSGGAGVSGGAGGHGINQRIELTGITIDSGGTIRGGGGGGGGGSGEFSYGGGNEQIVFNEDSSASAGGGGGGGAPNGLGGVGGTTYGGVSATNGQNGTTSGGGVGGAGADHETAIGSPGGNGGAFGSIGSASTAASGGAPGNAVKRNGFTSPFTNNGTAAGVVG